MRSKADMHGYQNRAATWLYEHDVGQAVLSMGSGKTVIGLTTIRELIDDGHIRCAVVLAPKRVAQLVWPAEPPQWGHLAGMKVCVVAGDPAERAALLASDAEVYVIGIDNVKWLVALLSLLPPDHRLFDLLCIDELSRFKSPRSKLATKHLNKIIDRFKIRWGLTGTPRPNDYIDQFRPLQLLTANGLFKPRSFDTWRRKHFLSDYQGFNWTIRPESETKIIKQIASVSFTIDPSEMPELPEMTTVVHWVDLPPKVMKLYRDMERDLLAKVGEKSFMAVSAGVASGKLAQIAQGFLYGEGGNAEVEHLHAAKADKLVDLVEALDGNPALLVYGFVEDLRVMQELYSGLPFLGNGTSDAKAALYEKGWNENLFPLLALHPASAGHGLNLQRGGNQMIVYDMPWSAELFDQTRKRFWRQGQVKRCFEHIILARGTVDEIKYDRVVNKMADQDAFTKYLKRI